MTMGPDGAILWRAMTAGDLGAVGDIAAVVHPAFPERIAVFAERLALSSAGCLIAADGGGPAGYAIAHPWRFGSAPALDSLVGALPIGADVFYLHDIALMPRLRGSGAGTAIAALLAERAQTQGFARLALVAVNESRPFWERQGFAGVESPELSEKLSSYGADAVYMTRDV